MNKRDFRDTDGFLWEVEVGERRKIHIGKSLTVHRVQFIGFTTKLTTLKAERVGGKITDHRHTQITIIE